MSSRELFYYTDFCGNAGWFPSVAEYRKEFRNSTRKPIRVAHQGIEAPAGYTKTGRGLANEPAVRIRAERDFVNALRP